MSKFCCIITELFRNNGSPGVIGKLFHFSIDQPNQVQKISHATLGLKFSR